MLVIKNFVEAHEVLHTFYNAPGTSTYTLDRMRVLMDYLGNPQDSLKVIHVAGTSGKTSTVYYAVALLEATGANVGMTVSPHVDEVNERVQINHTPLPEAAFCKALGEFTDIVEGSGVTPSYFELLVAFAYWEFARQKVDYVVVEVGLGGLLDATNVISREDKLCIITDIGLDHTNVLGSTLTEIATQKAGIIQTRNHVFAYSQSQEIDRVLMRAAHKRQATLHRITAVNERYYQPSLPLFQRRNLYLAEQAVNYVLVRDGKPRLTPEQIQKAAAVHIPARMELFRLGSKTLIIDGSHNSQKLRVLAASVRIKFPDQPIAALTAFVEGQDERWQRGVDVLTTLADRLIITSFKAEQDVPKASVRPATIAAYCRAISYAAVTVSPQPEAAFAALLQQPEPILLVTGSFYLLNHIRPLLI